MKEEKIKSLSIVNTFINYFTNRAKRALKLKESEYDSCHIDVKDRREVDVWFFSKTNVLARVLFNPNGLIKDKEDIIDKRKTEPETEIVTQGKPEDA